MMTEYRGRQQHPSNGSPSKMMHQYGGRASPSKNPDLDTASSSQSNKYKCDTAATSSHIFKQPQSNHTNDKENQAPQTFSRGREEAKSPSKLPFFRSLSPERRSKARSVSPFKQDRSKRLEAEVIEDSRKVENSSKFSREIDNEFCIMLGEMEVPISLRLKLMTLEHSVKESMIKGQASLTIGALSAASLGKAKARLPIPEQHLRKGKSSEKDIFIPMELLTPPNRSTIFGCSQSRNVSSSSETNSEQGNTTTIRSGATTPNFQRSPRLRSRSASASSAVTALTGANTTASTFATMLKTTDTSLLDVSRVKKMRVIMSSESLGWIEEFIEEGGYSAMVTRLKELLHLEWREEQHDDQLLHEFLRCFVVLSTTDRGRLTLQLKMPTPFIELSDLLYSEKRPGDLSTRRLLVELLILLPNLPMSCSPDDLAPLFESRETSAISYALTSEPSSFTLLFTLLHNLRDPTQESKVDFIKASHASRPFKTLISELLIINRDYFWIFCHSNRFWSMDEINIDQVECPKVPGGMTGGVEYEAMAYLTSLMKLINTVGLKILSISKAKMDNRIAQHFHSLLFASGMERALASTRKASQVYYQAYHLELARYFEIAKMSHFDIPLDLEVWQSVPRLTTTEYRYFEGRQGQQNKLSTKRDDKVLVERKSQECESRISAALVGKVDTGKWLSRPVSPSKVAGEIPRAQKPKPSTNHMVSPAQSSQVGHAIQRWEKYSNRQFPGTG